LYPNLVDRSGRRALHVVGSVQGPGRLRRPHWEAWELPSSIGGNRVLPFGKTNQQQYTRKSAV